jgi:hypothetical protein
MNMSTTPTTFDAWKIDCNSVQSMDNGTRVEYENPTCKELQLGYSRLNSYVCAGLPLQPAMLSTSGTISCVPCPNNQYSLKGAMMRGSKVYSIQCELCPYGGNCELGGARVRAKAGFWAVAPATATAPDSSSTPSTALKMLPCPQGYCCENRLSGCVWNSNDACQGNRRQQYPLCGGCQQGFSQAINGIGCVADSECGGKAFLEYSALELFVVWPIFVLYALYAASYSPVISRLHRRLRPAARGDGAIAVVVYFLQMAAVVVPSGYNSLVDRAAGLAGDLSMLRQLMLSQQGSACAWKGMSTVHKLEWQLCLPFVLLLLLPIVSMIAPPLIGCCGRLLRSALRCCRWCYRCEGNQGGGHNGEEGGRERLLEHHPTDEEEEEAGAKAQGERSWWTQLAGGVACLLVFSFTSFAESVLKLLHCAEVDGSLVLYYAGAVECKLTWQWLPWMLLIVLLGGPFYVVVIWTLRRRPRAFDPASLQVEALENLLPTDNGRLVWSSVASSATEYAHNQNWPSYPVWQAVHTHETAPFRKEYLTWTAVLMLQRLLTVMCQSLSKEALGRSIGVTIISFIFTLAHVYARPFHSNRVNSVQLLSMFCLTLIGVLNSAQASFQTAAVDVSKAGVLNTFVENANWAMFVLLLLPLLYFLLTAFVGDRFAAYLLAGSLDSESRNGEPTGVADVGGAETQPPDMSYALVQQEKKEKEHELADTKQQLVEERQRHAEENAELLAEKEQQLAAKDAEKEQQLAAKNAEMKQQLAAKDAEKEQQLAANEAKIEQLLAEMGSSGSKKSSEGASAAGAGATKKGRNQYRTVEQPIQR